MSNYIDSKISNRDYQDKTEFLSSTGLKYFKATSPRHFKAKYIDRTIESKHKAPAMVLGSLVHCLVLTPDLIGSEFVFMPDCDLRTKEGKAIKSDIELMANGRLIVSDEVRLAANAIAESVLCDVHACALLEGTRREVSYFWKNPLTGLNFRSRVDAIGSQLIELKTGNDMKPETFQRQAYNLNYDLSAAHYLDGLRQNGQDITDMSFITVETQAPYVVQCYKVSPEFLDLGHEKWLDVITRLNSCLSTGTWPGYIDDALEAYPLLYPPSWATKRVDISVDSEGLNEDY